MKRVSIFIALFVFSIATNTANAQSIFTVGTGSITENGYNVTIVSASNYLPYCGTPQDTFVVSISQPIQITSISFSPQWTNSYPYRIGFFFNYADGSSEYFGYNGLPVGDAIGKRPVSIYHGGECNGVQTTLNFTYTLVTSDITRAIALSDRVRYYESTDLTYGVYWQSRAKNFVGAMIDGRVTAVDRLNVTNCNLLALQGNLGCSFEDNGTRRGFNINNTYLVTIAGATYTTQQLIEPFSDGSVISVDTNVFAGCAIGTTFNADGQFFTHSWVKENNAYINTDIQTYLEPPPGGKCEPNYGLETCFGDADLSDSAQWDSNGTWNAEGVTLLSGQYLRRFMLLQSTNEPELIAKGGIVEPGSLRLTLGTTTKDIVWSGTQNQQVSIPAGTHAPSEGAFYKVEILNTGQNPAKINYLCVRNTKDNTGTPITQPPIESVNPFEICTVRNYSFTTGANTISGIAQDIDWSITGTGSFALGEANLVSLDVLQQDDVVIPAGDYTLKITTQLNASLAYLEDDTNTGTVQLQYNLGAGFITVETATYAQFATARGTRIFTKPITIASDTTTDFSIKPTLASSAGVTGLKILEICLSKTGTTNPGEEKTDICDIIATPRVSAGVGVWTTWLWDQLNKFYRCELIVVLNNILATANDIYTFIRWQMIYSQAYTQGMNTFITGSVYWLNGHLNNIATGRTTVIQYQSGEQCGNIFCGISNILTPLTEAIGSGLLAIINDAIVPVFNQLADLLIRLIEYLGRGLISGIVGLVQTFFSIVRQLIETGLTAFSLLNALLTAWNNATPIAIGIGNCPANPTANPICVGVWFIDNTIGTGNGAFIFPAIASLFSIRMVLWFIKRLRRTVYSVSEAF